MIKSLNKKSKVRKSKSKQKFFSPKIKTGTKR